MRCAGAPRDILGATCEAAAAVVIQAFGVALTAWLVSPADRASGQPCCYPAPPRHQPYLSAFGIDLG